MAFPEEKGFFGRMASSVSRAFVPPPDPQEAVKQWTKQIRVETRNIDKNIRGTVTPLTRTISCTFASCAKLRMCAMQDTA